MVAGAVAVTGCAGPAGPAASGDYSVTVTTPDDGEVVLTAAPARVGALNGNRVIPFVQPFLDEGHVLVGYGNEADPEKYPWIQAELEAFTAVDDSDGPNVEEYAAWDADLLIANGNVGDFWEPAREAGPLVQLPETDWRATTTLLGEIFQKPDVAEDVIATTEATIADARLAEPVTAAVLWPYQENGTVGTQVLGAELPNFLGDLNITVAGSDTAVDGYEDVSLELLAERLAGVDHVIVLSSGDDLQQRFLDNPVVADIPVIASGHVTRFTDVQTGAGFPVTPMTVPVLIDALSGVLKP
ncbi:ABC transporter substrate-binding protein [Quadrisphaera granulorum]|uniref:ABC transporter substrate-binding protein n=1 Tax=Quadrisphaera granulorum TaxID=317664 RepID=UPI0014748536|nr:ABC transporter substrate-binding protein [Quadrisphaera granulorum]